MLRRMSKSKHFVVFNDVVFSSVYDSNKRVLTVDGPKRFIEEMTNYGNFFGSAQESISGRKSHITLVINDLTSLSYISGIKFVRERFELRPTTNFRRFKS